MELQTAQNPASSEALDMIMDEMAGYGSEFALTFANHVPMVLVALERIGGDPERMRDFFEAYDRKKDLFRFSAVSTPLNRTSWEDAIGHREREPDLRVFFLHEMKSLGVEEALRLYLPRLAPGVAASAYHALMRMAYALLRNDPDEVAISLAYWSATYLAQPMPTGAAPIMDDPVETLVTVSRIPELRNLPQHPLLWQNMAEWGRQPAFADAVNWLEIGPGTLTRMAGASIVLFAVTQDFCALHAVTGLHWLRILQPFCTEATFHVMLRHFWQGVTALMGEMGFPELPPEQDIEAMRRLPAPGWEVIFAAARQSYDEHDLSLSYSAAQEELIYGDRLYRVAAARRLGLIPRPANLGEAA